GGPGDDTGSDRGAGGASGPPPPNLAAGTGSLDRPSTRPGFLVRNLTWRRAILGGVLAFALLGVAVAGYFVLWSQGIGAVGSLKAQGVFEEGERVVLADFSDRSGGAGLGPVVTEALRIDLVESPNLDPVSSDQVAEILERMELAEGAALGASVAREVAVRGGFKAVIEGDVSAAGSGFILTASIRDVQTGRPLAAFRETAGDEAAVIAAIDKLSQRIREKAGESLRSIKSGPELERVTTSSLEALRTFTRAHEAFERGADEDALALLEDAVALDPDFAMAWRLIAVIHQNTRLDPQAQREATVRAWELRDRLPSVERHLAEAVYHSSVTGDRDETIRAYESVLRIDPDHRAAVNNLAAELFRQGELARAEGILRRAVTGPAESRAVWANLVLMLAFQRKFAAAEEALAGYGERYPQDGTVRSMRNRLAMIQDRPQAETLSRAVLEDDEARPLDRIHALDDLAQAAVREGKLGEAREHFRAALEEAQRVSPALGWLRRLWWAQAEAV
ncbi:MAG TPA: tetratricopeptide repeat protein, partial [Longimicrobiales bacterium]|nr:tetratricopeptide repeat protein [Longimicrobiales bacterium]